MTKSSGSGKLSSCSCLQAAGSYEDALGMAVRGSDPAALLILYLHHDRLADAADLVLSHLAAHKQVGTAADYHHAAVRPGQNVLVLEVHCWACQKPKQIVTSSVNAGECAEQGRTLLYLVPFPEHWQAHGQFRQKYSAHPKAHSAPRSSAATSAQLLGGFRHIA